MVVAAVVVFQSWTIAGAALVPSVIGSHPLLLATIHGTLVTVTAAAAASTDASFWYVVVAPVPLWLVINTASWCAGRVLGPRIAASLVLRNPGSTRLIGPAERFVDRGRVVAVALGPLLPVPSALVHAACGWRRMPLALFLVVDMLGILARNTVFALLGVTFRAHAMDLVHTVTRFAAVITACLVVGMVAVFLLRRRAARRRAEVRRGR